MKTREVLRLIHEDGWHQIAQRRSHRQFKHPTKPGKVTVAGHPSEEMAEGTYRSISQTGRVEEMKEYAVVFERTSTGWSAYAPDLPGLGVTGPTYEETERLIRDGILFHIEGLMADGDPAPGPSARVAKMPVPA